MEKMYAFTLNMEMTRREFVGASGRTLLSGLVLTSSLLLQGCSDTSATIVGNWVGTDEFSKSFSSNLTHVDMCIFEDGTFCVTLTGVDTSKEDWPTYSEVWTEGKWLQVSDTQYSLSCYRLLGYAPNPSMLFELSDDGTTLTCMDKDDFPINTDSLAARISVFHRSSASNPASSSTSNEN